MRKILLSALMIAAALLGGSVVAASGQDTGSVEASACPWTATWC